MIDPNDQPDLETKRRTLMGEPTGWTYAFRVPDVCTAFWGTDAWITYIGDRWYRMRQIAQRPEQNDERSLTNLQA